MFSKRFPRLAGVALLILVLFLASTSIIGSEVLKASNLGSGLGVLPVSAAGTIYVDASVSGGAGTGSSWPDAYLKLQDALSAAASGDQIWVAAGVYYPDEGVGMTNDDRTATFTLVDGVDVYGGFAGGETSLTQRKWETNVTVLSGDVDQNDTTDFNGVVTDVADIVGSNAYHVVRRDSVSGVTAMLDGFTLTAGNADGSYPDYYGGGMLNMYGSPVLMNLIFSGNKSGNQGGGMHVQNGTPAFTNLTFIRNFSTINGGGMSIKSGTSPTLTNVFFSGNQSESGGGIYSDTSTPILVNVVFSGNLATLYGGGMYNAVSHAELLNVTFVGNRALSRGGGMLNNGSNPNLSNVIFWNNEAQWEGSQIMNWSSTPAISFSDIQDSGGSGVGWDTTLGTDGGNNIDANPLFVTSINPATVPTTAGDLHLQTGSPAIDMGDNGVCPATDLDGNLRPIDGDLDGAVVCDMGAYEKTIDLFLPLIVR